MPAGRIIHTVGPVWRDGAHGEAGLLASCYANCMALASRHGARSIAFPCISTGIYRFPPDLAARIALATVGESLQEYTDIERAIFCCYSQGDLDIYRQMIAAG